jgi:hypothetical protein
MSTGKFCKISTPHDHDMDIKQIGSRKKDKQIERMLGMGTCQKGGKYMEPKSLI